MEPVISTILQALAVGAQATAKNVATNETKRLYDWLRLRIQEQWVGKPDAETVLAAYAKEPETLSKEVLAQKLEESGVHQDREIYQQAELLIQKLEASVKIENSQFVSSNNYSRNNSAGGTATHGARVSKHNISGGRDAYINEGTHNESRTTNNFRQTRLAILLGILTLILVGVIGYLVKTGKIRLPNPSTQPISIPQPENRASQCSKINTIVEGSATELSNAMSNEDVYAGLIEMKFVFGKTSRELSALELTDDGLIKRQVNLVDIYAELASLSDEALADIADPLRGGSNFLEIPFRDEINAQKFAMNMQALTSLLQSNIEDLRSYCSQ
jgi:hypothetical protein